MLGNKKTGGSGVGQDLSSGSGKPVDTIDTLIGQKSVFKGDLEFSGGLRVDGQIKGNIIARDNASSTLVLSETGEIEGNVTVPHVVINGRVNGNVKSTARVQLQGKSQVNGDIHYKAVEMELGATINGTMVCQPEGSAGAVSPSQQAPGATGAVKSQA